MLCIFTHFSVLIYYLHVGLDSSHLPYSLPKHLQTVHSTLVKEQYMATEDLTRGPTDRDVNHTVPEPHQRQHERRAVVEAKVLRVAVDEGVDSIDGGGDLPKHISIV